MVRYVASEREALGHVDGREDRPVEFAVLAGASDQHPRSASEHLPHLRDRELPDLVAVGRSGRDPFAGRVERERSRTAPGVHVLAHPHVGVLLPEGVLVNLPVPSAIELEGVGHERLGLLPDLVGFLGDKLVFGRAIDFGSIRFVTADPVRERRFYARLKRRKNHQIAIVATARKLLVSILHMLQRKGVYDPPGVSS